MANTSENGIEPAWIDDDIGAIERGAEHCRIGNLAAIAAADAGLVDRRHGIVAQRIIELLHAERGASRQSDAGMIAGADILIDAETRLHHALAVMDRLGQKRPLAPLLIEHAF